VLRAILCGRPGEGRDPSKHLGRVRSFDQARRRQRARVRFEHEALQRHPAQWTGEPPEFSRGTAAGVVGPLKPALQSLVGRESPLNSLGGQR
jgi:hypothetical protein